MNNLGTCLKRNKKMLKFLALFCLLGLLIGFIMYKKIDNLEVLEEIKNISNNLKNNKINFILIHFIIISILITSSITVIGLLLFPLYFLFESISISYSIFLFTSAFKFNGLIYSIFYNILAKGLYLILMFLIFKKILNIAKYLKDLIINKKSIDIKYPLTKNIQALIICIAIIFVNDILIYVFLNKILIKLLFILN